MCALPEMSSSTSTKSFVHWPFVLSFRFLISMHSLIITSVILLNSLLSFFMRPLMPYKSNHETQGMKSPKSKAPATFSNPHISFRIPLMLSNLSDASIDHLFPIIVLHIIFVVRDERALLTFTDFAPFSLSCQMERIIADTSSMRTDWNDLILLSMRSSKTHIFLSCLQ